MDAASTADSGVRAFDIVAFAGSLRQGSFNRALLRAAIELAPSGLHITIHDLASLPLCNADVEGSGAPRSAADLREAVRKANALLIATPEYNHGVPGVLKMPSTGSHGRLEEVRSMANLPRSWEPRPV